MYLDYSKLEFDSDWRPEEPVLVLKTLSGVTLGAISNVFDLEFTIKYAEPSEISFKVPRSNNGVPTPLYDDLVGYKIIETATYGIYIIMEPSNEADGIQDVKTIKGYSLEKYLETKKFFLEEGTFNFWNPASPDDTIMQRILEIAVGWHVGYVAPSMIGRYRTFDDYDDYLLNFIYNEAPEKFRCVFVFDTYKKTINVYDVDEQVEMIPIFLSFENVLESIDIEEKTDELCTALRPYGADDLDIRDVNPIGSNWIYDLSYFIANGDIPKEIAEKWETWQRTVLNNRTYFSGLVALRSSATQNLMMLKTELADLQGELDDLVNQQSVIIQTMADEFTNAGKEFQQSKLDDINRQINEKKDEIAAKESEISELSDRIDGSSPQSYKNQIQAVVDQLSFENYFTDKEKEILSIYFIEQDMTESTFVASDLDIETSASVYEVASGTITLNQSKIAMIDLKDKFSKDMYTFIGGSFSISYDSGQHKITGDIVRATLDKQTGGKLVLSIYCGSMTVNNVTAQSGVISVVGSSSNFTDNIHEVNDQGVVTYEGDEVSFNVSGAQLFLTANASDYQRYSTQLELYDFAADTLREKATPTYEFSVDSANFIFAHEFEPFRNRMALGKGVYLQINEEYTVTPYIIEFNISFEDYTSFSITFSNRFKLLDNVNTLKDMLEQSYSSSRSFDASKYVYNQTVSHASAVNDFLSGSLDAAKNTILGAKNQSVTIDAAGIHVGGDSPYQIRIVDSMIAMTDDAWQTAKVAIGHFASPDIGDYWGVNADVIGGKLFVGQNLVIENSNDDGVMQFKVDSSGAWLYNSTFILSSDGPSPAAISSDDIMPAAIVNGGKIILDPRYGIVAGNGDLFTTSGTTVTPSFIGDTGAIEFDEDHMPKNSNFFLDIRDGNAYFRGSVRATAGEIGGFTIEDSYLYSGTGGSRVAINGGMDYYGPYAFWAGAENPELAKFWVKKDGSMKAQQATFSGTIQASKLTGELDASDGGWLKGCGIDINNGVFHVDPNGDLTLKGNINMSDGAITWGSNSPVKYQYSSSSANGPWHDTYQSGDKYRRESLDGGRSWGDGYQFVGEDGANGSNARVPTYIHDTYIDSTEIRSPKIKANEFSVYPLDNSGDLEGSFNLYGTFDGSQYHFFRIDYTDGISAPYINIYSPAGGLIQLGALTVYGNPGNDRTYVDAGEELEIRGTLKITGTIDMTQATILQ